MAEGLAQEARPRPAALAVSIVIPTYRRAPVLRRCLDRLEGQADALTEVIVVDDAQEDDPAAVARAVDAGARPFAVRIVHRHAPGVAAARNAGWRAAAAPLVLFLGDDILADPGLVSAHLAAHARRPEEHVGILGHVRWARELRVTPFMRFLEEGAQFDYAHMEAGDAGWGRLYTSNVSFKRGLLEAVGGFDEDFTFGYEDLEIGRRMHDRGLRLMYDPQIRAEHLHPTTLADWERRMAAAAPAERMMVAKHPDVKPYFHDALRGWRGQASSARMAALAERIPAAVPVVGPRVHAAARAHWKVTLADAFFAGWERGA
ncbi:glycosyltransferase [Paraconexibacter antarcticus]|uniref:Glycosyltransferase n=1 Tax=Paraconexibacter antarcticus TaxID=2949664 RepID=A0ABY5DLI3_9ACTN|nr:glycosyltransferase [Paraconexibacter antarcticus]UTI62690.1 glycosyltransferase [Paraconexibacter antarcticus]